MKSNLWLFLILTVSKYFKFTYNAVLPRSGMTIESEDGDHASKGPSDSAAEDTRHESLIPVFDVLIELLLDSRRICLLFLHF